MNNEQRAIWAGLKEGRPIYPNYPNDLAACFRDFEPKLHEIMDISSIEFLREGDVRLVQINYWTRDNRIDWYGLSVIEGKGDTYSEAFTNAVDKIIEEMKC